ncbi:MAG: hypothetical protein ABEI52_05230, partial [Halobacteriaceae archaeon]
PETIIALDAAMKANGLLEIAFGLALIVGFHTTITALIVAISMAGVVVALLWTALATGEFVDVLIRDVGLAILALGVTLLSTNR